MKKLFLLILFPALLIAQTRNIVPRAAGQGGIGTAAKPWATCYFDTVNALGPLFGSGPINIGSYAITSGLINGQMISDAASFTGTLTTAAGITQGSGYLNIGSYNVGTYGSGSINLWYNASAAMLSIGSNVLITGTAMNTVGGSLTIAGSFSTGQTSQTANYIAGTSDQAIFMSAASADTVFLPTAVGIGGRIYTIKKVDAAANAVTVRASGAELIDGANTYALASQYKYVVIQSNGTQWFIIGNN